MKKRLSLVLGPIAVGLIAFPMVMSAQIVIEQDKCPGREIVSGPLAGEYGGFEPTPTYFPEVDLNNNRVICVNEVNDEVTIVLDDLPDGSPIPH